MKRSKGAPKFHPHDHLLSPYENTPGESPPEDRAKTKYTCSCSKQPFAWGARFRHFTSRTHKRAYGSGDTTDKGIQDPPVLTSTSGPFRRPASPPIEDRGYDYDYFEPEPIPKRPIRQTRLPQRVSDYQMDFSDSDPSDDDYDDVSSDSSFDPSDNEMIEALQQPVQQPSSQTPLDPVDAVTMQLNSNEEPPPPSVQMHNGDYHDGYDDDGDYHDDDDDDPENDNHVVVHQPRPSRPESVVPIVPPPSYVIISGGVRMFRSNPLDDALPIRRTAAPLPAPDDGAPDWIEPEYPVWSPQPIHRHDGPASISLASPEGDPVIIADHTPQHWAVKPWFEYFAKQSSVHKVHQNRLRTCFRDAKKLFKSTCPVAAAVKEFTWKKFEKYQDCLNPHRNLPKPSPQLITRDGQSFRLNLLLPSIGFLLSLNRNEEFFDGFENCDPSTLFHPLHSESWRRVKERHDDAADPSHLPLLISIFIDGFRLTNSGARKAGNNSFILGLQNFSAEHSTKHQSRFLLASPPKAISIHTVLLHLLEPILCYPKPIIELPFPIRCKSGREYRTAVCHIFSFPGDDPGLRSLLLMGGYNSIDRHTGKLSAISRYCTGGWVPPDADTLKSSTERYRRDLAANPRTALADHVENAIQVEASSELPTLVDAILGEAASSALLPPPPSAKHPKSQLYFATLGLLRSFYMFFVQQALEMVALSEKLEDPVNPLTHLLFSAEGCGIQQEMIPFRHSFRYPPASDAREWWITLRSFVFDRHNHRKRMEAIGRCISDLPTDIHRLVAFRDDENVRQTRSDWLRSLSSLALEESSLPAYLSALKIAFTSYIFPLMNAAGMTKFLGEEYQGRTTWDLLHRKQSALTILCCVDLGRLDHPLLHFPPCFLHNIKLGIIPYVFQAVFAGLPAQAGEICNDILENQSADLPSSLRVKIIQSQGATASHPGRTWLGILYSYRVWLPKLIDAWDRLLNGGRNSSYNLPLIKKRVSELMQMTLDVCLSIVHPSPVSLDSLDNKIHRLLCSVVILFGDCKFSFWRPNQETFCVWPQLIKFLGSPLFNSTERFESLHPLLRHVPTNWKNQERDVVSAATEIALSQIHDIPPNRVFGRRLPTQEEIDEIVAIEGTAHKMIGHSRIKNAFGVSGAYISCIRGSKPIFHHSNRLLIFIEGEVRFVMAILSAKVGQDRVLFIRSSSVISERRIPGDSSTDGLPVIFPHQEYRPNPGGPCRWDRWSEVSPRLFCDALNNSRQGTSVQIWQENESCRMHYDISRPNRSLSFAESALT